LPSSGIRKRDHSFPHKAVLINLITRTPELVKLRFFAGLTMPEITQVLKILLATAESHWTYARTWLDAELKDQDNSENPQEYFKRNEGFRARSSH
jgi:hypothetical protein